MFSVSFKRGSFWSCSLVGMFIMMISCVGEVKLESGHSPPTQGGMAA